MNKNTKIIIIVVGVLIVVGAIYLNARPNLQSQIPDQSDSADILPPAVETIEEEGSAKTEPKPVSLKAVMAPALPQTDLVVYKGKYFPFTFSYPAGLKPTENSQLNSQSLETGSYYFNYLTLGGSISGYISFYANSGENSKYEDLLATYPDKYSTTTINGMKFYKHVEKETNSSNGYRIEYVTFKNDTSYRFSLIVTNADKKALEPSSYQTQSDMFEGVVKSLRIN